MSRSSVQRYRSNDVVSDLASFDDLLLPAELVRCLAAAGFTKPSPVQAAAVPVGRVGRDMIVQAKSGTGKTLVFSILVLDKIAWDSGLPQALIVAPTRELALQSCDVINSITEHMAEPRPVAAAFVGGLPTADDAKRLRRTCQVVVGTPGRLCALVSRTALPCAGFRQYVMDEADQLMADSFRADVVWLHQQLPARKQVLAFSATYTPELMEALGPLLRNPHRVLLCEETVSLEAIKQYYCLVGPPTTPSNTAAPPPATKAAAADGGCAAAAAEAADLADGVDLAEVQAGPFHDTGAAVGEPSATDAQLGLSAGTAGTPGAVEGPAVPPPAAAVAAWGEDTAVLGATNSRHSPEASQGQHQQTQQAEQGQQEDATAQQPDAAHETQQGGGHWSQLSAQQVLLLKVEALLRLVNSISFHQAVVFCNRKPAAEWLSQRLSAAGFPAAHLSADCAQPERMATMAAFRAFKIRILVSTDVVARGVDLERVNLVAALDMPPDAATYVHRVGRTGRFGTAGLAVAFVTAPELQQLQGYVASVAGGVVLPLPEQLSSEFHHYQLGTDWEQQALQALQQAPKTTPPSRPPPMSKHAAAAGRSSQQQQRQGGRSQEGSKGSKPLLLDTGAAQGLEEEEDEWEREDEEEEEEEEEEELGEAELWGEDQPLWLEEWQQQAAQGAVPPAASSAGRRRAAQQHSSTVTPQPAADAEAAAGWSSYWAHAAPQGAYGGAWGAAAGAPESWWWQHQQHPQQWGAGWQNQQHPQQWGSGWQQAQSVASQGAALPGADAPQGSSTGGQVTEEERKAAWAAYYAAMGWDPALLDAMEAPQQHQHTQHHKQQQQQQQQQEGGPHGVEVEEEAASDSSSATNMHAQLEAGCEDAAWEDEAEQDLLLEEELLDSHAQQLLAGMSIAPAVGEGPQEATTQPCGAAVGISSAAESDQEPQQGEHVVQEHGGSAAGVDGTGATTSSSSWPDTAAGKRVPPAATWDTAVTVGIFPGGPCHQVTEGRTAAPAGWAGGPSQLGAAGGCYHAQAWESWHQAYNSWLQAYGMWYQQCISRHAGM